MAAVFMLLMIGAVADGAALEDAVVAALAHELLREVGVADEIENAAFIVRGSDEALSLVRWPVRGLYSAAWSGPMPDGVVALLHTHPRHRPLPSPQDRAEARRLALPVYVASHGSLCVAEAEGEVRCARRNAWMQRDGQMLR